MKTFDFAMQQMIDYSLCVDFYSNTIKDSDDNDWYWQGTDIESFFECLQTVIDFLESNKEVENV